MKALQTQHLAAASSGNRIGGMPKKPSKKKSDTPAAEKYTVYARIPPELGEAFEKMLGKTRRSATAEVIVALEKHLGEAGLWPPSPSPE